jgi:hypothetical protein
VVLPGMHVPVVQAALHDRTREGHLDTCRSGMRKIWQDAGATWYSSLISSVVMSASAIR